jgi:hypothetical protein
VVVLADEDDAGVARLVSSLAGELDVVWWELGGQEAAVAAYADANGFLLDQPQGRLTSAQVRGADIVVYKRRLLQPRPLVASEQPAHADRAFSEREWTSLLQGLLLAEERVGRATWANPPSAAPLADNKLALLLSAARLGLAVPRFSVSTPIRPPNAHGALVTKAISADERIDDSRYFSTALVSAGELRELLDAPVPTPALLQEYVAPRTELRVFYMLGQFLCLALTPSPEHVDIRNAPRASMAPRVCELSGEWSAGLARLADELALQYCTFDLIVADDAKPVLIDITPNGDWDYFETDSTPLVTNFLAAAIVQRLSEMHRL